MGSRRNTIIDISTRKSTDASPLAPPLVCLTAYTAPVARLADRHADLILVGDSLGMVMYGMDSTLPVTMEMMIAHGKAVVKATEKALIAIDMPFGSYQESPQQAFRNAASIMKETGCAAVKLEGGAEMAETVSFLAHRGIPVMGHIGLQPQSVHETGGYRVMGRKQAESQKIKADAQALEKAGAFSIVLECVDPNLADQITAMINVPIIGIGASSACDGQILVTEDMLGLTEGPHPKFVKQYADLQPQIEGALARYAEEVKTRKFPAAEQTYDENKAKKSNASVKARIRK